MKSRHSILKPWLLKKKLGQNLLPLLPQLNIFGDYQYLTLVPKVSLPYLGSFPVAVHWPYAIGATLTYTVWDTFSDLNTYKSAKYSYESQKEIEENTKLQLLLQVRTAYLRVQLALENLHATSDSLKLVREQFADTNNKYKAGAIAYLDWISSQREVINYELQLEQQRDSVTSNVKDLYALLTLPTTVEIFDPEPPTVVIDNPGLKIQFDSLEESLQRANQWSIAPPTEAQPSLKSQKLLEQSYLAQSDSEWGKLWPKIEFSVTSQVMYPILIQLAVGEQNTFTLSFSMPIFDGLRILHNVNEAKQNALVAHFNHDQTKINLNRDYYKAVDTLTNLQKQREINKQDIRTAKIAAKLYYESYQAGKSILIEVQQANLQVLVSQVQGATILSNILNQLYQIQFLSGKIIL